MYTLAIDLGASFLKFGLFRSGNEAPLRSQRAIFPAFIDTSGKKREVLTSEILKLVDEGIEQLSSDITDPIDFLISTQMQGFVLVDPASGKSASHFISWQDLRNTSDWDEIQSCLGEDRLQAIGREIKPGHAVTTLFAMKKAGENLNGLMPVSLGDFVAWHLTGACPQMHTSNASSFGCWELSKSQWLTSFISDLGLEKVHWPDAADRLMPLEFGNKRRYLGTYGDFQASLLGAGLKDTESLSANIATGSQVSRLCLSLPSTFSCQIRPYFNGQYLKTVTHLPAGRALNVLLKPHLAMEHLSLDDVFAKVDSDPLLLSDLDVNLNLFPTSIGNAGAINNIREDNWSSQNLLRACLTRVAQNIALCRESVDQERQCQRILASGGMLTKSRFLQERLAEACRLPLELTAEHNDSLIGLQRLAKSFQ